MSEKTVFIIGAGASEEADIPTNYELKKRISTILDIDINRHENLLYNKNILVQALQIIADQNDVSMFQKDANLIRDALPLEISIDNFLNKHRSNDNINTLGKLAIVQSILKEENNSLLNFQKSNQNISEQFSNIEVLWFSSFFKLITENCDKGDLKERFKSLTLIVFNYDRCVEHFLFNALKLSYNITDSEASKFLKHITIYHPYGKVGNLPWENTSLKCNSDTIEFGGSPDADMLINFASKIKTFTEWSNLPISNMHYKIETANKIIFLGFAFHKLNMQLLTPPKNNNVITGKIINCYATAYKISESDKEDIDKQIRKLDRSEFYINLADLKCKDFFNHFWRSLSF